MANLGKTANIISSENAFDILTNMAKRIFADPTSARKLPAVILRGAPGCGKSSIVRQVADSLGVEFRDMRLADLERVDISGLPSVENGQTVWNVPSFLPTDPNSKGILLLDEITAAPHDCQVAIYALILDRCLPNSNYRLPDGWFIVAAGNRTTDKAVAKSMSSALANRFMHFEMEANIEEWCKWAVQKSIHPSVTGYLQYRPTSLFRMENENLEGGWPSPRAWERVSNMLDLFGNNEEVLRKIVYGLVGPGAGLEFMEFHRHSEKTQDVLNWLTNPKANITIPERAEELYVITSSASYLVWNGNTAADDQKRVDGLLRLAMKLPPSFASTLFKQVTLGNTRVTRFNALTYISKSPEYPAFAKRFKQLSEDIANAKL